MRKKLLAVAIAATLSVGAAAHSAPNQIAANQAASNDELAQIRSQLQSLVQRVDKLEAENATLKADINPEGLAIT